MKPLQKVVTAPDVESCLYYVHLDSEDDEKLLRVPSVDTNDSTLESLESIPVQNGEANMIKRKALLSSPRRSSESYSKPSSKVSPDTELPLRSHGSLAQPNSSPTQLTGPRPMPLPLTAKEDTATRPGSPYFKQGALPRERSEQFMSSAPKPSPQLPAESRDPGKVGPGITRERFHTNSVTNNYRSQFNKDIEHRHNDHIPTDGHFCLTLIRRYDGLQSNVGRIIHSVEHSIGGDGVSNPHGQPTSNGSGGTATIDILTPGYSKFNGNATTGMWPRPSIQSYHLDGAEAPNISVGFQRQLQTVRGSKRPQQHSRLDSSDSYPSTPKLRSSFDFGRHHREASDSLQIDSLSPGLPPDSAQIDARGFKFESPWHGSCEFSTGVAGRSLKCKHILGSRSESVSELRFNLPSSKAFGPSPPKLQSPSEQKRESRRSFVF